MHFLSHSVMFVLCTAYMLLLMLPVTVATCERSFSKPKLIKNFLEVLCPRSVSVIWRLFRWKIIIVLSSWIHPVLLTLLHKRRHENGTLTNDIDVGVGNWTRKTTILPKPSQIMAVFCIRIPAGSGVSLYLDLLTGWKSGATRSTDSHETWQGRRARWSAWLCKTSPQSVQWGNAATKCEKISTFW